ncbi:MAG TPA: AEC family transporter [Anaerolineae bacterium]|nr:AEC family transporter [Anaerolineae bacterium]
MSGEALRSLGDILFQVLAPIVILVAAGFTLQRRLNLDVKSINRVVYFVLSPSLVYSTILTLTFDPLTTGRSVLFASAHMLTMGVLAYLLARRWRYEGGLASAFIIAAILMNNGNYGLPLNLFAFGETGFGYALALFMFNAMVGGAVSIFLAIRGKSNRLVALRRTLVQPIVIAMFLGLFSRFTHIAPTGSLMDMVDMAGQAAIPVFLLVLGMSLAQTDVRANLSPVLRLTGVRMLVSPAVALGLAALVGLSGVAFSVAVMQASMPSAVNAIVITNEFDAAPDFTAGAVLMTTLTSLITLPALLFFLR